MILLLLLLAQADPEIDKRVVDLRSDSVEVRAAASAWLEERGDAAHPALEKASRDADAEVAARAAFLLKVLEVRKKLTPPILAAVPGIATRLAAGGPPDWAAFFLEAAQENGGVRKYPLTRADLDRLAEGAVEGVRSDAMALKVIIEIRKRELSGGTPALWARIRGKAAPWNPHLTYLALQAIEVAGGQVPAEELAGFLKHEDPDLRGIAARAAARCKGVDPKLIRPLLKDEDADVRASAAEALGILRDKASHPALVSVLTDSSERVRECAERALIGVDDPEICKSVAELLANPREEVRLIAVRCLARMKAPDAVSRILPLVSDPSAQVVHETFIGLGYLEAAQASSGIVSRIERRYAFESLKFLEELGGVEQAPAVLPYLRDADDLNRALAAGFVGRLKVKEALPQILDCLKDKDPSVRRRAAAALGRIGDRESAKALIPLIGDAAMRGAAIDALAALGADEAVFPAISHAKKSASQHFDSVIHLLSRCGDAGQVIPEMARFAAQQDADMASIGVWVLGLRSAQGELDLILRSLAHEKPRVRWTGLAALRNLSSVGSFPRVAEALRDPEVSVRTQAIHVLGHLDTARARPILEPLLVDPHRSVRKAAALRLCESGVRSGVQELLDQAHMDDHDLNSLNALRMPEVWRSLREKRWNGQGWSGLHLYRELEDLSGLKVVRVYRPYRKPGVTDPIHAWWARSLLDLIYFVEHRGNWILEPGEIRFVSAEDALKFWEDWWAAELRKPK